MYYCSSLQDTIKKVVSSGKKSIIVHHGLRGINEVQSEFSNLVGSGKNIQTTTDDVKLCLNNLNLNYEFHSLETTIDLTCCSDFKNPDGKNLIHFFLERDSITTKEEVSVRNFLKSKGKTMIHDMGVFYINGKK